MCDVWCGVQVIDSQPELKSSEVFFAQGTLRPDLIESASALASGSADAIKTHHNDTELVRQLRALGRVIEPLKDFHKDEVRQLGRSLGTTHTTTVLGLREHAYMGIEGSHSPQGL